MEQEAIIHMVCPHSLSFNKVVCNTVRNYIGFVLDIIEAFVHLDSGWVCSQCRQILGISFVSWIDLS